MLRISALNEELSEESSGVDEPIVPTKEIEVSFVRIINYNLNFNIFFFIRRQNLSIYIKKPFN